MHIGWSVCLSLSSFVVSSSTKAEDQIIHPLEFPPFISGRPLGLLGPVPGFLASKCCCHISW